MILEKCVICKKEFDGYGNNAEPLAEGRCCDACNEKVIIARLKRIGWAGIVTEKLYQTCGIDNAIKEDYKFAETIMKCLGKYCNFNWGDTCKEDCELNDYAINSGEERIVAKYKTNKGDIFIITECDRSATTILFAYEY